MSKASPDSVGALASRLRFARKVARLSQAKLAELAAVGEVEIARIEGGRALRPNAYVIARLCVVLNRSLDWMMTPVRIVAEGDPC